MLCCCLAGCLALQAYTGAPVGHQSELWTVPHSSFWKQRHQEDCGGARLPHHHPRSYLCLSLCLCLIKLNRTAEWEAVQGRWRARPAWGRRLNLRTELVQTPEPPSGEADDADSGGQSGLSESWRTEGSRAHTQSGSLPQLMLASLILDIMSPVSCLNIKK